MARIEKRTRGTVENVPQVAKKIIRRKLEIADNIIERKLEILDGFMRRKEQSKEDIRKAARELFTQFGFEKVSIADLARKAGVSQATIYNNFGSKENIEREYVITMVDNFINQAREILTSDKPYRVRLDVFIQLLEDSLFQPNDIDHADFPPNILDDPKIKRMQDEVGEKIGSLILEFINEGKKKGEVKSQISEEALSIFYKSFIGIFFNSELHLKLHRDPILAHDLLSLFIYGILGQQG
ncbi:MAG TPA: TetR/AcrR family transcriptional regulator [Dehalococcoidales bacterium]|nr:TetR/AcrR family transcriptional regulator [Dehalococcoidales bacterium]